jgi:hypothetical protein
MERTHFPAVERIPYPECVRPYLEHLDRRADALRPEDVDHILATGCFPPGGPPTPGALRREQLLVALVELLNDVIDSLNVLIADTEDLPNLVPQLRGRPSKRLELLVRGFYGEFFRGREVFVRVLGYLRREGYITREIATGLTSEIDKHFQDIYKMRHAFAHGDAGLPGKPYQLLRAAESTKDPFWYREDGVVYELVNADGNKMTLGDAAEGPCREALEFMRQSAAMFRAGFSTLIDLLSGVHGPLA